MGHGTQNQTRLPGVSSSLVWMTEEEVVHILPSCFRVRFVAGTDQVLEMSRWQQGESRPRPHGQQTPALFPVACCHGNDGALWP